MSEPISLSELQQAMNERLASLDYFDRTRTEAENSESVISIVNEDDKDLDVKIDKILGEIGLMILIGQPKLKNIEDESPETKPFNGEFTIEVSAGENPIINRVDGQTFIKCMDAMVAAVQRLHGFAISGWKRLAVDNPNPIRNDKKRQIYTFIVRTERVLPPI